MTSAVDIFNAGVTRLFDLLLAPFEGAAPIWGLLFLSVLAGVLLLLLYGRVSNQAGIRRVKKKIGALVLESVLFRHDLGVSLRAQARMLGQAFVYLGCALPPLVILTVPCLVILAQLNLRYSARGLKPGEHAILNVKLPPEVPLQEARLVPGPGLEAAPPVRVPDTGEIFWRLSPLVPGPRRFALEVKGALFDDEVFGIDHAGKLPAGMYASPWLSLFYPGRPALRGGSVSEYYLNYPEVRYSCLGFKLHWLVIFAVVSILAGLLAAKLFKIEI